MVDKVAEALYEEIAQGNFKPGEKLPTETEMSEKLGVARPTVREAVSRLIGLGLVERGDYGVFVAASSKTHVHSALVPVLLNEWEIRELYEARILVESDLVGLACQKATDEGILELNRINEKMLNQNMSAADYFKYDMEFHSYISEMSGNSVMLSMGKIINDMFKRYESHVMELHAIQATTYHDHKELIDAISKGDAQTAREIVLRTLTSSENAIYQLKERGKIS
ncbi:MAG: FadR/GntR family transcriptional regulator [Sphaerochaetaceae bacterium]|nr:FadR/GntR family transcriptional regulator [Sphaerochaetaceae bacterium]